MLRFGNGVVCVKGASVRIALTVILAFTMLVSLDIQAGAAQFDTPPNDIAFVDLDGDGISDYLADTDADGIPDKLTPPTSAGSPAIATASGIFATSMEDLPAPSPTMANSLEFGKRFGSSKALAGNRGGFGSGDDFGPGNGIGIGAISGGTCVGGICF